MKRMQALITLCNWMIVLVFYHLATAGSVLADNVKLEACVSDVKLPPFSFWEGNDVNTVKGFTIDLVNAITSKNDEIVHISVLPWARCLKMVEVGKINFAINSPHLHANYGKFILTEPYFTLHSLYFYSSEAHPSGLLINHLSDLKKYRVCGLNGYNMSEYGLDLNEVDTGTDNYRSLVLKLQKNNCDLFLEKREIIAGIYLNDPSLAVLIFNSSIDYAPLPEDPRLEYYFAFSAAIPHMSEYAAQFNQQIRALKQSNGINRLLKNYIY